MGFIMDGLDAEAYDRTYKDRQLIARIISYFRPKLGVMLFVAVLVVLNSSLDTAFPLLIAHSIDTLAIKQDSTNDIVVGWLHPAIGSTLVDL